MIVTKGILAGGRYPFLSTSINCHILLSRGLICDPIRDYLILTQHMVKYGKYAWANVSSNILWETKKIAVSCRNISRGASELHNNLESHTYLCSYYGCSHVCLLTRYFPFLACFWVGWWIFHVRVLAHSIKCVKIYVYNNVWSKPLTLYSWYVQICV